MRARLELVLEDCTTILCIRDTTELDIGGSLLTLHPGGIVRKLHSLSTIDRNHCSLRMLLIPLLHVFVAKESK